MAQRTLTGGQSDRPDDRSGSRGDRDGRTDEKCSSAVMAAMQAIGDHCGEGTTPVRLGDDTVLMAPEEEADRLTELDASEMSDRELRRALDAFEWLDEWARTQVETAGFRESDSEYDDARVRFARRALD